MWYRIAGALPLVLMVAVGIWAVTFIVYGINRMIQGFPICGW